MLNKYLVIAECFLIAGVLVTALLLWTPASQVLPIWAVYVSFAYMVIGFAMLLYRPYG